MVEEIFDLENETKTKIDIASVDHLIHRRILAVWCEWVV